MAPRKQGRRTAEEAERTKLEILTSAAFLFCEKGYNQVSIRDISERAGVTHSLIRHYFGAKMQIWHAIIEQIHHYVETYRGRLIERISTDLPANQRAYQFLSHFMAYMLKKPQLCQIMLDYIHHPENGANDGDELSPHIKELVDRAFKNQPSILTEYLDDFGPHMWRFLVHSGGAVAFKPFMMPSWPGLSYEDVLLRHWEMYEQSLVTDFNISEEQRLNYKTLDDLVIDIQVMDCQAQEVYQEHFSRYS